MDIIFIQILKWQAYYPLWDMHFFPIVWPWGVTFRNTFLQDAHL